MKAFTGKSLLSVATIAITLLSLYACATHVADGRFVGQTQATHPGGASLNTLHADCVAEFGP